MDEGVVPRPLRIGDLQARADYLPVPLPRGAVLLAHAGDEGGECLRRVATILNAQRLDALLVDLLPAQASRSAQPVNEVDLLAQRLEPPLAWLQDRPASGGRSVGVLAFAAAAVAALALAARHPERIGALVACGARVDLVDTSALRAVNVPTLLIVGGLDFTLVESSRRALPLLQGTRRLEVLPRADSDFAAPGALEALAHLAAQWLALHLGAPTPF